MLALSLKCFVGLGGVGIVMLIGSVFSLTFGNVLCIACNTSLIIYIITPIADNIMLRVYFIRVIPTDIKLKTSDAKDGINYIMLVSNGVIFTLNMS